MNLSLSESIPIALTWHVLIETQAQGQVVAWVAEVPDAKVIAESQEAAIAALQTQFTQRLANIKVLPLQISAEDAVNPWAKVMGALKNSESFIEWSDRYWAEKQQNVEDDEILSVEECLRVV
jgi:hypothetical protein